MTTTPNLTAERHAAWDALVKTITDRYAVELDTMLYDDGDVEITDLRIPATPEFHSKWNRHRPTGTDVRHNRERLAEMFPIGEIIGNIDQES